MRIVKNLYYPDWNYIKEHEMSYFSYGDQQQILSLYLQQTEGIRLYVTKQISDELDNTDLKNISYRDILLPATSIEVFFEDKNISTVLIQKQEHILKIKSPFKNKKLNMVFHHLRTGEIIEYNDNEIGFSMMFGHTKNEDEVYIIRYNKDDISKWINNEISFKENINEYNKIYTYNGLQQDKENNEYGKYLLRLCIKVFLYISMPQYKAIPITNKSLRREGKAGVKNRPNRPLSKVIYVPSVVNINNKSSSTVTGEEKKPHSRRGHFRMLRNERFKNKQGKLIFVRPCMIHGGSLQDKLYVARKIN